MEPSWSTAPFPTSVSQIPIQIPYETFANGTHVLENNRLLALPKKSFPKSHSDRFMAFVEKAPTTIQDLKDNFFKGAEYETQTSGTRVSEAL